MRRYEATLLTLASIVTAVVVIDRPDQNITVRPIVYEEASEQFFSENEARQIAWELLTPENFKCFDRLITRESNWRSEAANKQSSAKGVGQLLKSTYKNLGMKHTDDPRAQVVASLAYIGRKYGAGGPCAAKEHWLKHNWY